MHTNIRVIIHTYLAGMVARARFANDQRDYVAICFHAAACAHKNIAKLFIYAAMARAQCGRRRCERCWIGRIFLLVYVLQNRI